MRGHPGAGPERHSGRRERHIHVGRFAAVGPHAADRRLRRDGTARGRLLAHRRPDGALRIPVRQVDSAPDSTVTIRFGDEVQGGGAEPTLDQAHSEAYAVAVPEGCYADPSMRVSLFEASEPPDR